MSEELLDILLLMVKQWKLAAPNGLERWLETITDRELIELVLLQGGKQSKD
jgi:hypothetical protein